MLPAAFCISPERIGTVPSNQSRRRATWGTTGEVPVVVDRLAGHGPELEPLTVRGEDRSAN
jgi:hypothetical protein